MSDGGGDGVESILDMPFIPPELPLYGLDQSPVVFFAPKQGVRADPDAIDPHASAEYAAGQAAEGHGVYDLAHLPAWAFPRLPQADESPFRGSVSLREELITQQEEALIMGVQQEKKQKAEDVVKERSKARGPGRNALLPHQELKGTNAAGGGGVAA